MIVTTYPTAAQFLTQTQKMLEADEIVNSLMLGICLRLSRSQEQTQQNSLVL